MDKSAKVTGFFLQEKSKQPLPLTYSSLTYNPNPSPKNRHLHFCSLALLSVYRENDPFSCPLDKLWRHFEVSASHPIPPILTAKVSGIALLENCRYRPPLRTFLTDCIIRTCDVHNMHALGTALRRRLSHQNKKLSASFWSKCVTIIHLSINSHNTLNRT